MLSRTANSRLRSCRIRAIRNRYLARSRPGSPPQLLPVARRAERMALSTSASVALATSASGSSVDGSIVLKVAPSDDGTSRPPMNRP